MPQGEKLSDREFKLQILRSTLEFGTPAMVRDPLATADRFLEWCEKQADKPKARSKSSTPKSGQA